MKANLDKISDLGSPKKANCNVRVAVAMSGGVDSSVAAAMLKAEGYDVVGVTMQLWDATQDVGTDGEVCVETSGSCCSIDDFNDARKVAQSMDFPYYVFNMEEDFKKDVVDYFVEGYLKGLTPNPCVKCNELLKFKYLLKKVKSFEAELLVTGHYARVKEIDGKYGLFKGVDTSKDQTYFLFTLNQEELKHVRFPLGDMTKIEVRAKAKELNLEVFDKDDSQEVCFVAGRAYSDFIDGYDYKGDSNEGSVFKQRGHIVDEEGNKVGTHEGLYKYTIGQRKGLNLGGMEEPHYVTGFDSSTCELKVGKVGDLNSRAMVVEGVKWIRRNGEEVKNIKVKIRYRFTEVPCRIEKLKEGTYKVTFENPQGEKSVTPGQAAVFYDETKDGLCEVLGGGWISEAIK